MPLFVETKEKRPNRLEETKNEQYHLNFAKWALGAVQNQHHHNFIKKSLVNWSFYKGGDGQWIFEEDLAGFFADESGNSRHRIKISKNLIRPMVEQFVGNAVRLSYRARASSTSEFVINRREEELNRMNFYTQAKQADEVLGAAIDANMEVGDSPQENDRIVENFFVDNYQRAINNLLKYVEKDIDMDEIKVQLTRFLALTGLGVYKGYEQNGRYMANVIDPMFFFFDRSARKPDLSDAEYMGEWYYSDVPSILERFQNISPDNRRAIEQASQNNSHGIHKLMNSFYNSSLGGKIPVYEVYWRDVEVQEYGFIMDKFGYPFFTRINHESSPYTKKDLIKPKTDEHKKILKGKKKSKKIYVDTLRYAIFIPKEEVSSSEDIILEWGEAPYQETYKLDPSNVQFPYKCYTWIYDKGDILSPIDDAINPQRYINRLLSVAESHISNLRGSGTVIDKNAVDPRDGEEAIIRNLNTSKPIFVDTTRTGSVQNAVGTYGANLSAGTNGLFQVVREMQVGMQDVTGINEAMTGTQGGSDSLVGVLQSQIQRGSLIQEPFYYALTTILKQAYQHIATVGKRVYADSPRKLSIISGDKGAEIINITKDLMLEDFRVFIERTAPEETEIEQANTLMFTLLEAQLLDAGRVAHLFGRGTMDNVADAMREFQAEQREANILNAQAAQAEQQGALQQQSAQADTAIQQQQLEDDRASLAREEEADIEVRKIQARTDGQIQRDTEKSKGK